MLNSIAFAILGSAFIAAWLEPRFTLLLSALAGWLSRVLATHAEAMLAARRAYREAWERARP